VLQYGTLPGGFLVRYDRGRTATHEIGHYLGLFHTFQGGGSEPGDDVDDTPAEAIAAYGCPEGRNSSAGPGEDPIHDFMDLSDDACLTGFTPGQGARTRALVSIYRPSLFESATARLTRSMSGDAGASDHAQFAFLGASPNPARDRATFRFTLAQASDVAIQIYDVAGRLVRSVAEVADGAGPHELALDTSGLRSGVYFVAFRAGEAKAKGTLLVTR
jgi:hypothetical protein